MPLLDPGQDLAQAGEQGSEAVGAPAVGLFAVDGEGGEGLGLFAVVPAGPADEQGGVGVAVGGGVGDEAFLGYVEFAAVAPVAGFGEVGGGVLRGTGMVLRKSRRAASSGRASSWRCRSQTCSQSARLARPVSL